jgi:hypothetical protein
VVVSFSRPRSSRGLIVVQYYYLLAKLNHPTLAVSALHLEGHSVGILETC